MKILCYAALLHLGAALAQGDAPRVTAFSENSPGESSITGWEPRYFSKTLPRTQFSIVQDEPGKVLRIDARASAGVLAHRVQVDAGIKRLLRWRWKVAKHNLATRLDRKSGDDFPVRLYLSFDYDTKKLGVMARTKLKIARMLHGDEVPAAALCYVWDPHLPVGTRAWNAFTDRLRMIVVSSGTHTQWESVERDVYRDFQEAFGDDPPRLIAIGVGGDSDNTRGISEAYVSDITLSAP